MKNQLAENLQDQEYGIEAEDAPEVAMPSPELSQAPLQAPVQETAVAQDAPIPAPVPIAASPEATKAEMDKTIPLPPVLPSPPMPIAQDYSKEDMDHARDAASRQITPQTYESMYADKSTLGKIGTLFGLVLSGAGSGLAHQSNAVMDMMNNVIKNDLDAQKSNVANSQNFLNMAYQHELQQAQIRRSEHENLYTDALRGQIPLQNLKTQAEIYYNQQLAKGVTVDNAIKQTELKFKPLIAAAELGERHAAIQASLASSKASQAQTGLSLAQTKGAEAENVGKLAEAEQKRAKANVYISALEGAPSSIAQPSAPQGMPPSNAPGIMPANEEPTDQMPSAPNPGSGFPHPEDIKHASIVAPFRAENAMLTSLTQRLQDSVANNPQGQAVLQNSIIPAVVAKQQQNNARAQAASELNDAQHNAPINQGVINDPNRFDQMMRTGQVAGPGLPSNVAIDPSDQGEVSKEKAALEQNRQLYKKYINSFNHLQDMDNAGQVPYGNVLSSALSGIGAIAGPLIGGITGGSGGVLPGTVVGSVLGNVGGKGTNAIIQNRERARNVQIETLQKELGTDMSSMLPAFNDPGGNKGKVRVEALKQGNEFFKDREAQLAPLLMGKYKLVSPFPERGYDPREYIPPQDYSMNTIAEEKAPRETKQRKLNTLEKNSGMSW